MGHVVSFTPKATSSPPKRLSAGDAAAIIIFPGVRYERVSDAAQKPAPAAAPVRPRQQPKH